MDKKTREYSIDVLRTIGTMLIILAHVNLPVIIKELRAFDVCLLVLISGFCCTYKEKKYFRYLISRIKRLCFPAWLTATLIFFMCFCLCLVVKQDFLYSFRQIIETYTFIGGMNGGIGLFWIVRIYLLMAIISPLLIKIEQTIDNNYYFMLVIGLLLLSNEALYYWCWGRSNVVDFILENYIMSLLGYSAVFLTGIRLKKKRIHNSMKYGFFVLYALVCIVNLVWLHNFPAPNTYKYPPRLPYLLYGLSISLLLFVITRRVCKQSENKKISIVVKWISKNSYTIYFCHAIVLKLFSWGDRVIRNVPFLKVWIISYLLVISTSVFMTYVIDLVKRKIKAHCLSGNLSCDKRRSGE